MSGKDDRRPMGNYLIRGADSTCYETGSHG